METNIFEEASRLKLRFPSVKGELTTEQLWDLPLTTTVSGKVDLDTVARTVNTDLKAITEDSFVQTRVNPQKAILTLKLDVLRHVIAAKQAENAEKSRKAANESELARLREVLADKNNDALKNLSPEQIQERIKQLGG